MNSSRRGLLKALPFVSIGAFVADKANGSQIAEATAAAVEAEDAPAKKMRTVFVFRMKNPATHLAIENLKTEARRALDANGFSGAVAFILPAYLELDIFQIEGAEPCSESAQSK